MLKHKILWLVLTIVFAVLMIVMFIANPIVYSLGVNVSLNNYLPNIVTSKKKQVGGGTAPDYYTSAWDSKEDLEAYEDEICQQLEGEGAALLMNNYVDDEDEYALPLHDGDNLSVFSISSYDFMYGGTGSGAVKTDTAEDLPNALFDAGFGINGSLAGKYYQLTTRYKREVAGATGGYSRDYKINEAPVDELSSCESFYEQYGDAAIVTLARSGGE
ncbi:MAG: glycosyl hydrolase, partial [Clostridia bacterium]|nr:glycosyl hydrolase [Clostridia bacterium]